MEVTEGNVLYMVLGGMALLFTVQWGLIRFGDRLWKPPPPQMSEEIEVLKDVAAKVSACHGCGTERDATVSHLGDKVDGLTKAVGEGRKESRTRAAKLYEKIDKMDEKIQETRDGQSELRERIVRVETKVLGE